MRINFDGLTNILPRRWSKFGLIAATCGAFVGYVALMHAGEIDRTKPVGAPSVHNQLAMTDVSPAPLRELASPGPSPISLSMLIEPKLPNPGENSVTFAIGDRLKLTVFERLSRMAANGSDGSSSQQGYVERVDLGGEHIVQQDGAMFLPLLGSIKVIDRARREVQQAVAAAYSTVAGRNIEASIDIIEREPIYVLGSVARPGTYKHAPSLTVLHVVALSGGFEGANQEPARMADALREEERQFRSRETLKRLVAKQAVLESEKQALKLEPPKRLIELVPAKEAWGLMGEVQSARDLMKKKQQGETAMMESAVAGLTRELVVMREKVRILDANIKARSERMDRISTLNSRGLQQTHQLLSARSDLYEVDERRLEVMNAISRTEMRVLEVRQGLKKLEIETEIERERELEILRKEIANEEATLNSSSRLKQIILGPAQGTASGPGKKFIFELTRRTDKGPQSLTVNEQFQLHPGDLLRITNPAAEPKG